MNENLFDKVSNEKLDMLHEALSEVISDMRSVGENSEACFCDESYWACYSLTHMIFASLRRREQNQQVNRL